MRVDASFRSECWCRTEVVDVTPEMTRRLETASCGRKGCHRNHVSMRGVRA